MIPNKPKNHSTITILIITIIILFFIIINNNIECKKEINLGFNFAAEEAGAKILTANPEAKKVSRILNEDTDKYCLIPRNAPSKFIIIELSEEIAMTSLALANFEYYSCSFKHFKVFGSVTYPCKKGDDKCWDLLGTFQAQNTRKVQNFNLKKPSISRYIKLEFLSHYGENEYYCTLSLIRVYGSTLLEDLKKSLQKSTTHSKSNSNKNNENVINNNHNNNADNLEDKINNNNSNNYNNNNIKLENNVNTQNNLEKIEMKESLRKTNLMNEELDKTFGKLLEDDLSRLLKKELEPEVFNNVTKKVYFFRKNNICEMKEKPNIILQRWSRSVISDTCPIDVNFNRFNYTTFVNSLQSLYNNQNNTTSNNSTNNNNTATIGSKKGISSPNTTTTAKSEVVVEATKANDTLVGFCPFTFNNMTKATKLFQMKNETICKIHEKNIFVETDNNLTTNDEEEEIEEEEEESNSQEDNNNKSILDLMNERENILKSLFHAVKTCGENEAILRSQLKSMDTKYHKTFQYVQQILEKNGEDHKILANTFMKLNQKNKENIINELRLDMENKLKQKLDILENNYEQRFIKMKEEYSNLYVGFRYSIVITTAIVFAICILIQIASCGFLYIYYFNNQDERVPSLSLSKQRRNSNISNNGSITNNNNNELDKGGQQLVTTDKLVPMMPQHQPQIIHKKEEKEFNDIVYSTPRRKSNASNNSSIGNFLVNAVYSSVFSDIREASPRKTKNFTDNSSSNNLDIPKLELSNGNNKEYLSFRNNDFHDGYKFLPSSDGQLNAKVDLKKKHKKHRKH
ncbi:hypothetical protein ABK040_011737 [Willaertia magna]